MSTIPADVFSSFSDLQQQIWHNVSETVTQACGRPITFESPECTLAATADVFAEDLDSVVAVQFAFSEQPDSSQLIIVPPTTLAAWASAVRYETITEVDENIVADLRESLEAIVQGFCLAVSSKRGEPTVASNLTIRFQTINLPQNLVRATQVAKTDIQIKGEGFTGTAFWMADEASVHFILGISVGEHPESQPSAPQTFNPEPLRLERNTAAPVEETQGLDILLDIPLEISVELGRVKMLVKEVVDLGTGSIVEIQKAAGEPVDVLVNGRLVARGEVVVIEDNFGVRITEILTTQERLGKIGEAA